jgi:hypothetical protein
MLEFEIKNKVAKQWQGTADNDNVKYAIESARTFGNRNTVSQDWRWLADDLGALYESQDAIAAATYSYITGWLAGASAMLNRALSSLWK